MDLYDSLESFIEAYLYFDETLIETEFGGKQFLFQDINVVDDGDYQDFSNVKQPWTPQDNQISYQILDSAAPNSQKASYKMVAPMTQLDRQTIHTKQQVSLSDNTRKDKVQNCFKHNLEYNTTNIKASRQLNCEQCLLKCSDSYDMRYHHLTCHWNPTSIESAVNLRQPSYSSIEPGQPSNLKNLHTNVQSGRTNARTKKRSVNMMHTKTSAKQIKLEENQCNTSRALKSLKNKSKIKEGSKLKPVKSYNPREDQ